MHDDLTPEHYWAAGFLEGEGSFLLNRNRVRIVAGQKEREPLERLKALFGGSICWSPSGPIHYWNLSIGAKEQMQLLRPLMSSRRQGQIDKALAESAARLEVAPGKGSFQRSKETCPNGHAYDKIRFNSDGTFRGRVCTTCRNERRRTRYQTDTEYREKIKAAVAARRQGAAHG
jgi:hypothetical protein